MKTETYEHQSFGQINFSRVNGHANFYGSELRQDNYIELTVKHSEVERELTQDRYYAKHTSPVLRVRMSTAQFSELITTMNQGDGPCCTIEVIDGKRLAELPEQESRKEFVHRAFEERMKVFAMSIKEYQIRAKKLIAKKTLSKDDMKDLTYHIDWLSTEVSSNIPFFGKCFQETMDDVVHEAKLEVENAIQHKISVLGLEELHKQNNALKENNIAVSTENTDKL